MPSGLLRVKKHFLAPMSRGTGLLLIGRTGAAERLPSPIMSGYQNQASNY